MSERIVTPAVWAYACDGCGREVQTSIGMPSGWLVLIVSPTGGPTRTADDMVRDMVLHVCPACKSTPLARLFERRR